jgi:aminoglycoside 3-N-acetyltransferase
VVPTHTSDNCDPASWVNPPIPETWWPVIREQSPGFDPPAGRDLPAGGKVLLLGCGHDSNTSLHLAEWRQTSPPRGLHGSAIRQPDGTSKWTTWIDVIEREDDFEKRGEAFEAAHPLALGKVGNATARLIPQRALVDYATTWLAANRGANPVAMPPT